MEDIFIVRNDIVGNDKFKFVLFAGRMYICKAFDVVIFFRVHFYDIFFLICENGVSAIVASAVLTMPNRLIFSNNVLDFLLLQINGRVIDVWIDVFGKRVLDQCNISQANDLLIFFIVECVDIFSTAAEKKITLNNFFYVSSVGEVADKALIAVLLLQRQCDGMRCWRL